MRSPLLALTSVAALLAISPLSSRPVEPSPGSVGVQSGELSRDLRTPQEKHLRNVRQLTFGGENAEAYFNPDGTRLIFQSRRGSLKAHGLHRQGPLYLLLFFP